FYKNFNNHNVPIGYFGPYAGLQQFSRIGTCTRIKCPNMQIFDNKEEKKKKKDPN
ncbi:7280_t:CDS:1, partial [Dentiscutata heterogama]